MIGSKKEDISDVQAAEVKETTPKERVQIELKELKDKILKLTAVLYGEKLMDKGIDSEMIVLMEQQLKVMQTYAAILQNRLAHWEKPERNDFYHPYKAPSCGC